MIGRLLVNLALAPVRVVVAPVKVLDDLSRGEVGRATVGTLDYVVTGDAPAGSAVEGFAVAPAPRRERR